MNLTVCAQSECLIEKLTRGFQLEAPHCMHTVKFKV